MTRMIERWFPCAEVSANSATGWGSSNSEVNLFPWFAKRPLAQARAAALTSLLPWPDSEAEQEHLQKLVRQAMSGYAAANKEVLHALAHYYPNGARTLDPFSGRGLIPLESARFDIEAHALDYLPMPVLGSLLLIDYPMRDWSGEPPIPFDAAESIRAADRLGNDAEAIMREVGQRTRASMAPHFPQVEGRHTWGYLWAITLPCQECGLRFPMVGSLELRAPTGKNFDQGQSFRIDFDPDAGTWRAVVHNGEPQGLPTLRVAAGKSRYDAKGKVAICPNPACNHVHTKDVHTRLAASGQGRDEILIAADFDEDFGKAFRPVTDLERDAAERAGQGLRNEPRFSPVLPAVPDEPIPAGNTWTVQATVFGAATFASLTNDRQTLGFVHTARHIADIGTELLAAGASHDYAQALCGYATAVMLRKLRRSTRGCTLDVSRLGVHDVFATESSLNFSYDYFEVGINAGPGSWDSVKDGTLRALRGQLNRPAGRAATVQRGTARQLPYRPGFFDAVITDPPYDALIDYSDASNLFYVWAKRAMSTTWPDLAITDDATGIQDAAEEMIVKKGGGAAGEHRTRRHYDTLISEAFGEARRVVGNDGIVTIIFGHGEPEVWQRLLTSIRTAGLILTGSWPAKTEKGGKSGSSNIVTTLTMACRPAPANRPEGRKAAVEAEIRAEVKKRVDLWQKSGLAPTDMVMAAAGPAMEVVGRYERVLDATATDVDIAVFLPLSRAAVQEAMAIEIDHHPLETFDARTRFALWWVRVYGRQIRAKSDLRWEALAASMDISDVKDLVPDAKKGCQFVESSRFNRHISGESATIDVALAMAAASADGLDAVGDVMVRAGRDIDDTYLWAAIGFLADRLPASEPDTIAFTRILRGRGGIGSAVDAALDSRSMSASRAADQPTLF